MHKIRMPTAAQARSYHASAPLLFSGWVQADPGTAYACSYSVNCCCCCGCCCCCQLLLLLLLLLRQGHEANQKRLGSSNGIDTLLVCLAGFKSREPADAEEQEFVENLFDTLCSCLLLPANR
jgi:hypothetical protein